MTGSKTTNKRKTAAQKAAEQVTETVLKKVGDQSDMQKELSNEIHEKTVDKLNTEKDEKAVPANSGRKFIQLTASEAERVEKARENAEKERNRVHDLRVAKVSYNEKFLELVESHIQANPVAKNLKAEDKSKAEKKLFREAVSIARAECQPEMVNCLELMKKKDFKLSGIATKGTDSMIFIFDGEKLMIIKDELPVQKPNFLNVSMPALVTMNFTIENHPKLNGWKVRSLDSLLKSDPNDEALKKRFKEIKVAAELALGLKVEEYQSVLLSDTRGEAIAALGESGVAVVRQKAGELGVQAKVGESIAKDYNKMSRKLHVDKVGFEFKQKQHVAEIEKYRQEEIELQAKLEKLQSGDTPKDEDVKLIKASLKKARSNKKTAENRLDKVNEKLAEFK